MNENLDLTKILEGCPEGTKLYSSIYGDVYFTKIDLKDKDFPVLVLSDVYAYQRFTKNGKYNRKIGECILFPSKDQRDWSKFERFWDKPKVEKFDVNTLQHFDKVLVRADQAHSWNFDLYSHINVDYMVNVICIGGFWKTCIPYNEETKHLVGTKSDCPEFYKWWEE